MFSRISQLFVFAIVGFAMLASAKPWATTTTPAPKTTTVTVTAPPVTSTVPASTCSTGDLQCCNSVEPASSSGAAVLLGLLGIVLQNLDVIVGITCSPITAIGVGGDSCTQQTVCCENNNFNGLIAIGCTPVNLAL